MTRILYWNVENFSNDKINAAGPTPLLAGLSVDRRNLIGAILAQNPPDIFVMVEVFARTTNVEQQGTTVHAGSNAGVGVNFLLAAIRATPALGPNWCLVPPLHVGNFGYREGVAVFYNAATVQFTGPYVWSQPNPFALTYARPANVVANITNLQNYPGAWAANFPPVPPAVPAVRNWTQTIAGTVYNVPEQQSAGQWEYFTAGGAPIYFPGVDNRAPFYTRFVDAAGRVIKLFSVHTSPATAVHAVNQLPNIQELAPAGNEVSVIVGDLNVDTFDPAENGAYAGLDATHDILLDPRDPTQAPHFPVVPARKPYCMTHLLPLNLATPWNTTGVAGPDPRHNVYPRFGYCGSTQPGAIPTAGDRGAIDNVLVRYGAGLGPVPGYGGWVVNRVVGKPFNAAPAPPGTADLTGGPAYPSSMGVPLPLPGGVNQPLDPTNFLGWNNYGVIRSTSDHLPVVAVV